MVPKSHYFIRQMSLWSVVMFLYVPGMLTELDTVMGPLSLTSSMSSMVHYTRQGVHWLRMDSQKVKWPTTCCSCCSCCCCCCCCWMSANPPSCLSSLSCPSGLWQSSLSSLHMNVNSSHVLEDITLIIALIFYFFLMSTLVFLSLWHFYELWLHLL